MRRNVLVVALALAVVGVLITAQPSQAQRWRGGGWDGGGVYYGRGWDGGYYGRSWDGMYRTGYYYPSYSSYYYPSTYYYTTYDNTGYMTPGYMNEPTYPVATEDDVQNPNAIFVRLNVPQDARVWFDNYETQQGGTDRLFCSPPVQAGKDFVYHIKAQWMENGKAVVRAKDVTVHAGDTVNVDMMTAAVSNEEPAPSRQRTYETGTYQTPPQSGTLPTQPGTRIQTQTTIENPGVVPSNQTPAQPAAPPVNPPSNTPPDNNR